MIAPDTRYASSAGVSIAYQVVGSGRVDLVYVAHEGLALEAMWEQPVIARAMDRLSSFSRLILFDPRGTGASDPLPYQPLTLEGRMEDIGAVLDTVGSEQAALFASSDGGPASIVFAATHPKRTSALVLYDSFARMAWSPDYACGLDADRHKRWLEHLDNHWGDGSTIDLMAPSVAGDERWRRWWAHFERVGYSKAAALALLRTAWETDTIDVLPTIQCPTLVLHRAGDRWVPIGHGRFLAERIPGARFVELTGNDHVFYVGDADAVIDEIEEFLTGVRRGPDPHRVLATVLFTDIVASTELATAHGDHDWHELLDRHRSIIREQLARFSGTEIDTVGDGFLARFDGPGRAVRCAQAVVAALEPLGLAIRAGLHTGEIEVQDGSVSGIALHIGARIAARADPGEILVSSTVKDLVAGSGIMFTDRGLHSLKGLPDEWRLYRVDR